MSDQTHTDADIAAAVARYFEGTRSMSAETWSQSFTEDAVVDDPVGTPIVIGSEGVRTRGEEFITQFESVGLHESFVHVYGLRAVAKWTGRGVRKDGREVSFEGINVFEFTPDGQVKKLEGFWDPAQLAS